MSVPLSQERIIRLIHGHLLNPLQTYLLGIISQIIVYGKYNLMWYTMLNDEPRSKRILKRSINLADAALYKSLV